MPTVKMVGRITGTRDGIDWPPAGGLLDVDAAEAEHLVSAGLASLVERPLKPSAVEAAIAEPVVETAATPARKRRG